MTVSPEAITAAAEFIHDDECDDGTTKTCGRWKCGTDSANRFHALHVRHVEFYRDKARLTLEAAAAAIPSGQPGSLQHHLLGRRVRVTLAEHVVQIGRLLGFGEGGDFELEGDDGLVYHAWPMLSIEAAEGGGGHG